MNKILTLIFICDMLLKMLNRKVDSRELKKETKNE